MAQTGYSWAPPRCWSRIQRRRPWHRTTHRPSRCRPTSASHWPGEQKHGWPEMLTEYGNRRNLSTYIYIYVMYQRLSTYRINIINITSKQQNRGFPIAPVTPGSFRVTRDPRWLDHFDDPNKWAAYHLADGDDSNPSHHLCGSLKICGKHRLYHPGNTIFGKLLVAVH